MSELSQTSASYFTNGDRVGSLHKPSLLVQQRDRGVVLNHTLAWGAGGRWRTGVRLGLIWPVLRTSPVSITNSHLLVTVAFQ